MKFFITLEKIIEAIIRLAYFSIAVVVIAGAMYLLGGFVYLRGAWGTDTINALSMLVWIDKYFPKIPFWYPIAGGGISLTHSYPIFSFYLVSFIKRISSFNLFESFSLLGFSSILLTAVSLYLFVALRLKNQTAALLSALFYLISPISWTWLINWGFYAESISYLFLIPSIFFWDLFFSRFIKKDFGAKTRLLLLLVVLTVTLGMVTHFLVGFALIRFFSFYLIGYLILGKGERKAVLLRGIAALLIVSLFTYLTTLCFSLPFQRYAKIAAEAGLSGGGTFKDLSQGIPGPLYVLGFKAYGNRDFLWPMNRFSFPMIVSVLGFLGILLSFRDKKLLSFSFYALFGFFLALSPYFYWYRQRLPSIILIPLSWGTDWRMMFMILRLIWPVLAAFGIVKLVSLPFFWLKKGFLLLPKNLLVAVLSLVLAAIALYTQGNLQVLKERERPLSYKYGARDIDTRNIWGLTDKTGAILAADFCPYGGLEGAEEIERKKFEDNYLPVGGWQRWCHSRLALYFAPLRVADVCTSRKREGFTDLPRLCFPESVTSDEVFQFWQSCEEGKNLSPICGVRYPTVSQQMKLENWPKFTLAKGYGPIPEFNTLLEQISQENPRARLDFSPYRSSESMISAYYNYNRSLSQSHIYLTTASLILRFQGWQQIVYYLNDPQYDDPELINNLASWFGINYVFVVPNVYSTDEEPIFKRAGWEVFQGNWEHGVLRFPQKNLLSDLSRKMSVLAIGQKKVGAYDQVLTVSSLGVLPYQKAFIIWGKEAIDDYNLEELNKFDLLFLHGYTYKNRQKTNQLLKQYVDQGGRIFIDTGWQYSVPDWKSEDTLEIIPLKKLNWLDLGKAEDYQLEEASFGKDVNLLAFAPLVYEDQPWGVSSADKSTLKSWAKPVLSIKNYPLIAVGQLGKGKVVWSGMNLLPHVKQKEKIYKDEIKLLANLFSWLTEELPDQGKNYPVDYQRDYPDKVEFSIKEAVPSGSFLLWKEGYFPDFKANLVTGGQRQKSNLDIYRAGPGWSLIRVPQLSAGDRIIYEYRKPWVETAAMLISGFTILCLLGLILESLFLKERSLALAFIRRLDKKFSGTFSKLSKRTQGWWEKEDEE